MKTLLLNKEDVKDLARMTDVIAAVEEAYKAYSGGQVVQPGYMAIHLPPPPGGDGLQARLPQD